jgi:hypothetical protein
MWHKAWAEPSQGVAGRPAASPAMCPADAVLMVSNAQRRRKEETWPLSQVAWPTVLTSGPHVPNIQPQHCLTTPINTMVLPLAESVKRVRFSPLYSSQVHSCRVERGARF